ncbi:unnamed protein product [Protopolystoma xenopodis]|uniref:Uncharacterized protein n=1 Tax=Protopolystoma xenopodis TaxID=117903 RepID=A0A3S5ARJ1_9PLAT|nr:unnamed protein product [Protopolystoma xenopodis]
MCVWHVRTLKETNQISATLGLRCRLPQVCIIPIKQHVATVPRQPCGTWSFCSASRARQWPNFPVYRLDIPDSSFWPVGWNRFHLACRVYKLTPALFHLSQLNMHRPLPKALVHSGHGNYTIRWICLQIGEEPWHRLASNCIDERFTLAEKADIVKTT